MGVVLKAPFPEHRSSWHGIRNTVRYLFGGAAKAWARNFGAVIPALSSMTLLLLLSGLVGLAAFSLQRLAAAQEGQAAVLHVYLRDDATADSVAALRAKLTSDQRVASVGYTSKANALQQAQRRPGLGNLATVADDNPYPASFDIRLHSVQDEGAVASSVSNNPAVDPVLPTSYNPGSAQRIQQALTIVAVVGIAFLLLLGFVAVAVTANSIRAAIYARQDEVEIMQLVGAPRWMVRGPFLVEGALTGGIAGLVAGAVTLGVSLLVMTATSSAFAQVAPGVTIATCLATSGLVLLAGLALGTLASLFSVRQQMVVSEA